MLSDGDKRSLRLLPHLCVCFGQNGTVTDPDRTSAKRWGRRGAFGRGVKRAGKLIDPGVELLHGAEKKIVEPAWKRVTEAEPRWQASLAVGVAIALQITLPDKVAFRPHWLLPAIQSLMLLGLVIANPLRINKESRRLRIATIALIAVSTAANAWSAGRLVVHLVQGTLGQSPAGLLLTGAAIWMTNIIVFSLWYWEGDRGGPAARAAGKRDHADFLFAQMQSPEIAPPNWEAGFVDYLFLSFTNAAAFSPTDVLPLSRWAKLTMMIQASVSLGTVALVIARAVNILKG